MLQPTCDGKRKEEVVEYGVSELKLFLDKTLSYFWIAIILFGWFSSHFAVKESIRPQLDGEVRELLYTYSANASLAIVISDQKQSKTNQSATLSSFGRLLMNFFRFGKYLNLLLFTSLLKT